MNTTVLQSIPFFSDLKAQDILMLLSHMRTVSEARGTVIYAEDDAADHLYILLQGEASINMVRGARRVRLGVLGAGDYFGEMGLIDNHPRSVTVVAETEVQLLILSKQDFRAALVHCPDVALKIMGALCEQIRSLNQQNVLLTQARHAPRAAHA